MNYKNKIFTKDNHSLIPSYPINYYNFPLAKNCQFIEIDLYENEYIYIPSDCMHWVFTEPFNLSMNYFISSIRHNNENLFFKNLKKKQPFKNKINNNINFTFKDFLRENLDYKFSVAFSSINHMVPVKKPNLNCISFFKIMSIRESLASEYKNYFKYIAQNEFNEPYLYKLENFITDVKDNINYSAGIWINFDKSINSGLHYDSIDNILVNFIGKKKILLAHPNYRKYMYFEDLPIIDEYR